MPAPHDAVPDTIPDTIPPELLGRLSEVLAERVGWRFPVERWPDLARGLAAASLEFGFKDVAACVRWLLAAPLTRRQIEVLSHHLTVGETYFFRDKRCFTLLETQLFPELIRARRVGPEAERKTLRIWSAGCCTGEEPYSLAILLRRLLPDAERWQITIRATDLNPLFLEKAKRGVYSEWSFRDTPAWLKTEYFKPIAPNRFELLPKIRQMVKFSSLNLVEDVFPAKANDTERMDFIFCRNVLMYFTPEQTRKTIAQLHQSLVEGGWLIPSPSESSHHLFPEFVSVNFPGAIFYQKGKSGAKNEQPPFRAVPGFHALTPPPRLPQLKAPAETAPAVEPSRDVYAEALALYEAGRYGQAAGMLENADILRSDRPRVMALLARIYANQGRLDDALNCCEKALAGAKLNAGYHYLHATIFQEQNRWKEAIAALKRALFLDHDFILAHFALGNIFRQQGRSREANRQFENALSLLSTLRPEELLPESEGLTAGRLAQNITAMMEREAT